MRRAKVTMQLSKIWTTFVTALVALLTALGFTHPATAAAPQQETATHTPADTQAPAAAHRLLPAITALPPTMKQRIRAEAHGSSPTARHAPRAFPDPDPAPLLVPP